MSNDSTDLGLGSASSALIAQRGAAVTHAPFPTRSRPRLLVPRAHARAAEASIRAYTVSDSRRTRWGLTVAGFLARMGATRLAPGGVSIGGDGTFIHELHRILGRDDLVTAVHLGPPRANRKPVLRIMDVRGRPVAFAKLGINPLTCARIRHESEALVTLQSRVSDPLVTPTMVEAGNWDGLDYFVMRPVLDQPSEIPSTGLRQRGTTALRAAFPTATAPLADASWWTSVWASLQETPQSPEAERLTVFAKRLRDDNGSALIDSGAGHGDWSRWNMSADQDKLVVWDWERFASDVPNGWDELHYVIGSHANGVAAALVDPDRLLREALPDRAREDAALLLATYLLQRGAAYISDRQFEAGARTGALGDWLLPALDLVMTQDNRR